MANYGEQSCLPSIVASSDLSAKQYHIVSGYIGAGKCVQASLNTDQNILGVVQNAPQNGESATVAYMGRSKIVAGAAITANVLVTTNSSGRAVAANVGSAERIVGRALEAAAADGDIISAQLFCVGNRG